MGSLPSWFYYFCVCVCVGGGGGGGGGCVACDIVVQIRRGNRDNLGIIFLIAP